MIVRFPAAALAILTILAPFTMGGCASGPRSRPEARDPDVAWVCARHDLVRDLRGRITFEDVQRTLCDVGRYSDRLDFRALEAAALAEAGRCGGTPAAATGPSSLRGLFDALERVAAGQPEGCVESAMIAGMVRALGRDYRFTPVPLPRPPRPPDEPPATLNKTIVYVKLSRLLQGGEQLVESALRTARRDQAMTGLIVDVRGADGAPVDEMARFVDFFIDDGTAVEWRVRLTGEMSQIAATRRPPAETLPLVVLIDEKTRSGAEAFAGVLRARGRALLIGRRTMGLAMVQPVLALPSGSLLTLPVGDLIEPGVGLISGRGVAPDVTLEPALAGAAPESSDADDVIRFGVQVLSATRSGQRADLIDAAQRMLAWRSKR